MRLVGSGLMRRAEADGRLAGDHRRLVGALRGVNGFADRFGIEPVDVACVPAGGFETGDLVDRIGERGLAVDRNAVVVVEDDKLRQPEVAGDGDRLLAHSFHQIAVGGEHIGAVIDDAGEMGGEHPFRDRHPDRGSDALAERSGGRLHPERVAVFGVARGLRADLPKVLQIVDRQPFVAADAGQIKQGVQQHRSVSSRQDEAVAVGPVRVGGVELQDVAEENRRDVGRAHGQAGVAALGLLHRVDGEKAYGVGHRIVRHTRRHGRLLGSCRWFAGGFRQRPSGRTAGVSNGGEALSTATAPVRVDAPFKHRVKKAPQWTEAKPYRTLWSGRSSVSRPRSSSSSGRPSGGCARTRRESTPKRNMR